MISASRDGFAGRKRVSLAAQALAGTILAFALSSCGASERDTDDAGTPRGGTSGTSGGTGGASAGTGGASAGTGGASGGTGGSTGGTGGAGGSSGGGAAGTGGNFNPCAGFVPMTSTVCAPPFTPSGTGGAAGTSNDAGASGEAGMAPTIEECRASPPFCQGAPVEITVQDGLCCVRCTTICG